MTQMMKMMVGRMLMTKRRIVTENVGAAEEPMIVMTVITLQELSSST